MINFEFATAGKIIFGVNTIEQLSAEARRLGRHALIVGGKNPERIAPAIALLADADVGHTDIVIAEEPQVDQITDAAQLARDHGCDLVIGCGGGSVIDAAKAIAALLTNTGQTRDYLEVIGQALPLTQAPVPCIAIPTTAGTGSEVTRNAVLRCPFHKVKVSMRSPLMLPDVAIVDPALTLSMPPDVTAATGFDALTQLLEAFVSRRSNPMTDGICRQGLAACARSLATVCQDGRNLEARTDMALASMFSGLALANAALGAVHGIAGPLGGMHAAPHGAICARLLPVVTRANVAAMKRCRAPHPALSRYDEAAGILTGRPAAVAADGIGWIENLVAQLHIPALSRWGLRGADIDLLVAQSLKASSMKGNPVALTRDELTQIISQAMESER